MTSGADSGLGCLLLIERLQATLASRRYGQLLRFLREQIAQRLLLNDADIDGRAPLMSLGMSSLQVMEIKMLLEQQLARPLPSSLVFDYPTLVQLVPKLLELAGLQEEASIDASPEASLAPRSLRPNLAAPQGDVLAQLAAELAELRGR